MKKNYLKLIFTVGLFSTSFFTFSQTKVEIENIKNKSNVTKLVSLSEAYKTTFLKEKKEALEMAAIKGWRVKFTDDKGSYHELMRITKDGSPVYYQTHNSDAALSTRTNWLHNNGGLGLNIEGQGMTAYVWDAGLARSTHQEYDGLGGDNRYSIGDGSTVLNFHGAHVTGTIIASGLDFEAKGMAPQAKAIGHDWNNDDSEITDAAANGMLLSNHSYGTPPDGNGVPDWLMGAYSNGSRTMDEIMYNAPYYLNVTAAGNSGNDNTSNGNPLEGNSAFDKLTVWGTSKNNLVIANAQDATIDAATGNLLSVVINSGSSEGPTDDLRIKPDITGNGTSLHSSMESADDIYGRLTGTSMSSPNVTGSLLLLQQHYNNINGSFMRSATLKGLALQTADDNGIEGPDAVWGWGLLNTKKAAEVISGKGLSSVIDERVLAQGETYTITVKSDGTNPLLASISWTDLPGNSVSGIANDDTAVLVNDLDIKVTQNTDIFNPWKLTGVNSNTKGDNTVDPYERIDIAAASGEYTITVTHKGTLADGPQAFSLIVTGIQSDFTFTSTDVSKTQCSDSDAVFNFDYVQTLATTTNFSIQNLPAGMSSSLSSSSISADGAFTLTLSGLQNVAIGTYEIQVIGDNGNETETRTIQLKVIHPDFSNNQMSIASPLNGQRDIPTSGVTLRWDNNINAESYDVEFSDNPSFNNIIASGTETDLDFQVSGLESENIYYWRVKPSNRCGVGDFSEVFSFQTNGEQCTNTYSATDFSNATINSFSVNTTASVPIEIVDNLTITRIIVNTSITHDGVEDIKISIREPSALGFSTVVLVDKDCDTTNNVEATFSDTGTALACNNTAPAISGTILPLESLSLSAGENAIGTWLLLVNDTSVDDGGQIDSASITVCTEAANTSVPDFTNNNISVAANDIYVVQTSDIEASTSSETPSQQMYTIIVIPTKGNVTKNGSALGAGDTFTQEDINLGNIAFINTQTALFTDSFKVDIMNGVNGWLPNQVINLEATTLSSSEFELTNLAIYPNPTQGSITIRFETLSEDKIELELFDLQGRSVYNKRFETNQTLFDQTINIGRVSNGVYLLKATQGNRSATKRVIISR